MKGNRLAFFAAIFASALTGRAAGLVNLSARAHTSAEAGVLIAGFVIGGDAPKRVLVRAAGPALSSFGVAGALSAVRLDLYRGSSVIASNDGWDAGVDAPGVIQATGAAGAFAFAPGSRDAALLVTLAPGNYTTQALPGAAATAGVVLVEVYDADLGSSSRLTNLSARGAVGAGAETFTVGFVVAGDDRNRMLVRAAGPTLARLGVASALADPRLEVFRGSASAAYNDDWEANANPSGVSAVTDFAGAFRFDPGGRDAAVILPGARGAYTAQVTGPAAAGGIAVLEVYDTAGRGGLAWPRSYELVGFARVSGHGLAGLTGGGQPASDYHPATRAGNFWRIDDDAVAAAGANFAAELQAALGSDAPLVVELNTMLDLSQHGRPNTGATAITHPDLIPAGRTSGVIGLLAIGSNKTIYSAFGNGGFRRGTLTISGKHNIMLRNLRFRELWEWDDATAGDYDRNGWDYLVLQSTTSGTAVTSRAHHIWIDHCDFEKCYDGLFDIVHGADLITVSHSKLAGALSGESVRWVQRQMDFLEANRSRFPYYNQLRQTLSAADILRRELFQKKGNLVGNATDAATTAHDTGHLNVTFHHNWYVLTDQRMPRMRFGNAHVFNQLVESTAGAGVSGLTLAGIAATSNAAVRLENSRFHGVRTPVNTLVGLEPPGRITVLGSFNFGTTPGEEREFDSRLTVPLSAFAWNRPAAATGVGNWPQADTSLMPENYWPEDHARASYIDPGNAILGPILFGGNVIVPADASEAELLRRTLQRTTAPR